MGGWVSGRGNAYDRIDFTEANLLGVYELTAAFTDCDFSGARLDKVKFARSGLGASAGGAVTTALRRWRVRAHTGAVGADARATAVRADGAGLTTGPRRGR
jgi:hypothetical protein